MSFLVSAVIGLWLVHYAHVHDHFSSDHTEGGPQKFHATPTPRIGGVPIVLGMLAGGIALAVSTKHPSHLLFAFCLAAIPAFAGGLAEDVTKRVGAKPRLLLTFVSALLGAWLYGAMVGRLDLPLIDVWLQWWPLALLVTMVAVGGVAHAFNIIDGYNGLAGMVSILILGALGYACFKVNDWELLAICVAAMGSVLGFLLWNYPRGLIFAGDGGAYFLGFIVAEISVLLVLRHPKVSAWFPLLLVIYPVWETLFSIYRKKVVRGHSPGIPDGLHLHMLIYKRMVRWMVGSVEAKHMTKRNSATSPYLWGMTLLSVVPAVLFWKNTPMLMIFVVVFIAAYVWLYLRIIRFRIPGWMVLRSKNKKTP